MRRRRNCSSDPRTQKGSEGYAGMLTQAQSQRLEEEEGEERKRKQEEGAVSKKGQFSCVVILCVNA